MSMVGDVEEELVKARNTIDALRRQMKQLRAEQDALLKSWRDEVANVVLRELDCPNCARLRNEVTFWKEQRNLAASIAATIGDLDEVAPALRQLLRQETDRRKRAEAEVDRLTYRVEPTEGAQS